MSRANQLTGSEWLKNSFSIWRGFGKDGISKEHPAPFPVELVSRLLDCYVGNPQGVVLDPFAGSGSALLAALKAGMSAVGIDINPAYRDIFLHRLSMFEINREDGWRYETHDSRKMDKVVEPDSVDICITSPPYWDILNRRRSVDRKIARPYSKNGHDLGNACDYDEFLSSLILVAEQVEYALHPGSYFILNVMDIRKGSVFYPLHADAMLEISGNTGMVLEDIIIWDRQADYNSMRPLGYPHKFIINKVHEYLLVFRKEHTNDGEKAPNTR